MSNGLFPEGLDVFMDISANLRDQVIALRPTCPECNEKQQVQIIDYTTDRNRQEWKCRTCKNKFFTEYELRYTHGR